MNKIIKTIIHLKLFSIITITQLGLINLVHGDELNAPQESNRVAIVVNKYLKQEIEDNLSIYLQDLKNEGYEPILKEWDLENDPAPQALKAYLKGLYVEEGSLQGAVFIGDLPIPIMEADPLLKATKDNSSLGPTEISNGYIAERYYMDLVGKEWIDKDNNYKFEEPDYQSYWESFLKILGYDTPEGLRNAIEIEDIYPIPEIWTSRIVTSTLTYLFKQSEGKLVNAYLVKNHGYRTNKAVFQTQALIYSLPDVMKNEKAFHASEFIKAKHILSRNYEIKEPIPGPAYIYEFFEPLSSESYEIIFWGRHGLKTEILIGLQYLKSSTSSSDGRYLRNQDMRRFGSSMGTSLTDTHVHIKTAFVFAASCWIGHYTEPAYFAGSYLFNEQFYAFGMLTATLPTYDDPETLSTMSKLVDGSNFGLALKKAFETPYYFSLFFTSPALLSSKIASSNSKYILGDGTLKLQSRKLVTSEETKNKL